MSDAKHMKNFAKTVNATQNVPLIAVGNLSWVPPERFALTIISSWPLGRLTMPGLVAKESRLGRDILQFVVERSEGYSNFVDVFLIAVVGLTAVAPVSDVASSMSCIMMCSVC